MNARVPFVHLSTLLPGEGADAASLGGAVTEALCGRSDHDGPCRWPHNNAVVGDANCLQLRTVFISDQSDESGIRGRIDGALRGVDGWTVVSSGPTSLAASEQTLAERLATDAHRPPG